MLDRQLKISNQEVASDSVVFHIRDVENLKSADETYQPAPGVKTDTIPQTIVFSPPRKPLASRQTNVTFLERSMTGEVSSKNVPRKVKQTVKPMDLEATLKNPRLSCRTKRILAASAVGQIRVLPMEDTESSRCFLEVVFLCCKHD